MSSPAAERVIDRGTLQDNDKAAIARLLASGYMGPFGVPFSCRNCDFYEQSEADPAAVGIAGGPIGGLDDGGCGHPKVKARVAADGCCDRFTRNGVGNSGSLG